MSKNRWPSKNKTKDKKRHPMVKQNLWMSNSNTEKIISINEMHKWNKVKYKHT